MVERGDIKALRRGDQRAFERLYRAHKDAVHAYACSRVGPGHEADDLVQDAFMGLIRAADRLDFDTPIRSYLLQSVLNRFRDLRRSEAWRRRSDAVADEEGAPGPSPSDDVADRERRELVGEALDELPALQGEAVRLRIFGGLGYAAIAGLLGVPTATVRTRYRAGLLRLEARLQRMIHDDGPNRRGHSA